MSSTAAYVPPPLDVELVTKEGGGYGYAEPLVTTHVAGINGGAADAGDDDDAAALSSLVRAQPKPWAERWRKRAPWIVGITLLVGFVLGGGATFGGIALYLHELEQSASGPPPPTNSSSNATNSTCNSPTGGCANRFDVTYFVDHQQAFNDASDSCGRSCLGIADASAKCIEAATGVSATCAMCYGLNIACGAWKCIKECFWGPCPACDACTAEWCTGPLTTCVNIPPYLMP